METIKKGDVVQFIDKNEYYDENRNWKVNDIYISAGYTHVEGYGAKQGLMYSISIPMEREQVILPLKKMKKKENKNLFVESISKILFVSADTKNDNGFMQMSCGQSSIDNLKYVVTTNGLHADEIPEECTDAKTFSELIAKLLNEYYNKK